MVGDRLSGYWSDLEDKEKTANKQAKDGKIFTIFDAKPA